MLAAEARPNKNPRGGLPAGAVRRIAFRQLSDLRYPVKGAAASQRLQLGSRIERQWVQLAAPACHVRGQGAGKRGARTLKRRVSTENRFAMAWRSMLC